MIFALIVCATLAAIPAVVWAWVFYSKDPVYRPKALITFAFGVASVLPILTYKWSWNHLPQINIFNYTSNFSADLFSFTPLIYLPLGSVFAFMFVGVIEEYVKHLVVRKVDEGFFKSIDDAIEFSILAALGFAFMENILYFYNVFHSHGEQVLLMTFVFRSLFSTFAHILFSGIFGYFYGMAYFAEPIWSEKQRESRGKILNFLHRSLHFKRDRIYAVEKTSEGLVLAASLHAMFNLILETNLTFLMVPFLVLGYAYLDELFKRKENLKELGYLLGEDSRHHMHQVLWDRLPHFRQ